MRSPNASRPTSSEGPDATGDGSWEIRDSDATVGRIWVGPHPPNGPRDRTAAWIHYLEIDTAYRGHGFGRSALALAEDLRSSEGVRRVALNVLGSNTTARLLYRTAGDGEVAVTMAKELDGPLSTPP